MNRIFLAIFIVVTLLFGGCASLPPGSDFPKNPSMALEHPEQTMLGNTVAVAAQQHPEQSGFRILTVGVDGFLTRAQMINRAERTIDLQYYIFHNDETGQLLADALLRAADRGVRVRILLDDGESTDGDEKIAALQAHPKIEVRLFNPFSYRGHVDAFRFVEFLFNHERLDYRMHNKLLAVDNSVALIGGRNLADGYFQVDPEEQFGDDDVFSVGPIVSRLSSCFDDFWNDAITIPAAALMPADSISLDTYRAALVSHRAQMKEEGISYATRIASGEPLAGMLSGKLPLVWATAQVVSDSPEKSKVEKGEIIGKLMHRAVAREVMNVHSELLMISPYLIPGDEGMKMLRDLRAQNVRVRILTNSMMSTNVAAAQAGYMRYRKPLLDAGVELYEVRASPGNPNGTGQSAAMNRLGRYSLHAKLFVFDRQKLFIGSMNFDQRSMHLNTEIGLIIDSPELARQTAARFDLIVKPANSYQVFIVTHDGAAQRLGWRTEENGRQIELDREPATSAWRRVELNMMSLLPLDSEL